MRVEVKEALACMKVQQQLTELTIRWLEKLKIPDFEVGETLPPNDPGKSHVDGNNCLLDDHILIERRLFQQVAAASVVLARSLGIAKRS